MKVLHVITGLGVGGAEMQLKSFLQHTRHECDVVTLYNPGPIAEMIRGDGNRVRDLGMTRNTQLSALFALYRLIRGGRYDVVHTHLYRSQVYGRPAAWLAGTPVVLSTEHSIGDTHLERRKMTRGVRALYLATEWFSDATIAVSQTVRDRMVAWGVRPARITVIPNGVDLSRIVFDSAARAVVRAQFGILDGDYVIGVLGRLDPNKQFDLVIEAAAPLLNDAAKLLVVGKGEEQDHLEKVAAACGVTDKVLFAGERHDVAAVLSAMDLFVASSAQETFGLSVLEALGNGVPVLYTTCPALEGLEVARAGQVPSTVDGLREAMAAEVRAGQRDRVPSRPSRRPMGSRRLPTASMPSTTSSPPGAPGALAAAEQAVYGTCRPARHPSQPGMRDEDFRDRRGRIYRVAPCGAPTGRWAPGDRAGRSEHRAAEQPARGRRPPGVPPGAGLDPGPEPGQRAHSGCQQVYHLAAAVGSFVIRDRTLESLRTNIHGTENVVEAAARYGAVLLAASTSEIYGKNATPGIREDDDRIIGSPLRSRWSYAEAKAIDESLIDAYSRERGLKAVIIRFFNTVGPRQTGRYGMVIPRFTRQALAGEPITVYGTGDQVRCFCHVHDVIPALTKLMATPAAYGLAINLGNDEPISINDLAKRIIVATHSTSAITHSGYLAAYGSGYEDIQRRMPDCGLARRLCGFTPHRTLDDIIEAVIEDQEAQEASSNPAAAS